MKLIGAVASGAIFIGLLSGCAALDRMEAENFRKKCESLGISHGSPAFDSCILQQQSLEEQGLQRSMDRSAERELIKKIRAK